MEGDPRILNLATELSDAEDKKVPIILLQIKEILNSASHDPAKLISLKKQLWQYDVLQVCVLQLKQDFSKITGGWKLAIHLAEIISLACAGLNPDDSNAFHTVFLPDVIGNFLVVMRKLQTKFIKTLASLVETKQGYLDNFVTLSFALVKLVSAHSYLAKHVLVSSWLLQMLLSDDVNTIQQILSVVQSCNRIKIGVFGQLDEKVVFGIFDELIYKLSATNNSDVASASATTVLVICDSHPSTVETICARYKGLRPLLNKWLGKGFDRDLKRLMTLLEAGNLQMAEVLTRNKAASAIQATWKSFKTQKQLTKANQAMSRLQKSFRAKQELAQLRKDALREQKLLEEELIKRRKARMRQLREEQLATLRALRAEDVAQFLQSQQRDAATCIQRTWRGAQTRMSIPALRKEVREMRAAVTIQRSVRRWLRVREARRNEPAAWQRPPGLTDERRVELQQQINDWREKHELRTRDRVQQEELHERVQSLLRQRAIQCKQERRNQQKRAALLAVLQNDSQLLIDAPSLKDATENTSVLFASVSTPVVVAAQKAHAQTMKDMRAPWWKKETHEDRVNP